MKKNIYIKTNSNLYIWWNIGSMVMIFMIIQFSIGLMISLNYFIMNNLFDSSMNIYYNLNYGWMLRLMHSNLTSILFIKLIMHMSRNIFFKSFYNLNMWMSGMMMMMMFMLNSFLGYSLTWSQMSYWGIMVITNFISIIPKMGKPLLLWLWGNFMITSILLNRIFIIHYIIPIMIMILSILHMLILHNNKSFNPLGISNKFDLINIYPYHIMKDMNMFFMILLIFININLIFPFLLNNNENFINMNYFKTPNHIEPEWYFLLFYSMLRLINNKMGGMMITMMFFSMLMFIYKIMFNKFQSNKFQFINKKMLIIMMFLLIIISWLGKKIMEFPFYEINLLFNYILLINFLLMYMFNKLINK